MTRVDYQYSESVALYKKNVHSRLLEQSLRQLLHGWLSPESVLHHRDRLLRERDYLLAVSKSILNGSVRDRVSSSR